MYEISEVDQIIYKGRDVIIIPESLTNQITNTMHDLGHNADTNLIALIKQYFYYASMYAQVHAITQSCPLCQRTNISKRKEPYGFRPLPARPFSEISIDHKTLDNGWYVLVILDIFSRYPDVAFVKSTSFEATREPLLKYFSYFSTPLIVRSDNGSPFGSERFREFSIEQNFQHQLHTPRSPQANSEVERVMQTIGTAYERAKIRDKSKWREEILDAIKAKRATPHPALGGMSPYEVLFGRKMRPGKIAIAPWISNNPPEDEEKRFRNIENQLFDSKQNRKQKYEETRNVKEHDFRVGDQVLVILEKTKLKKPKYEKGIYQITQIKGTQITAISTENPNHMITRHSEFFKRYIRPLPKQQNSIPEYHEENNDEDGITVDESEDDQRNQPNEQERNQENRNNQAADPAIQQRRVQLQPQAENEAPTRRSTRSRGPAPEIPNVLPAAIEYSNRTRREIQEIHERHEAEARRDEQ